MPSIPFGLMAAVILCCNTEPVPRRSVLGDNVGIAALHQAITCPGKRCRERGVIVLEDEALQFDHHRPLGSAVALSRSKCSKELWIPECVSIANSHEHTAGEVHTVFVPELLEGQRVCNGMPTTSPETPG